MSVCGICKFVLPQSAVFCSRCGAMAPVDGADMVLGDAIAVASQLLARGETDRAIAVLTPHATATDPEPWALFSLGAAYLQRGRYDDALPVLARAVERNPDHAQGHAYLAMAYLHTYQPAEAYAAMNRALELAPDDFAVNLKQGELLARLGYYRESIAPLEHALATVSPDAASLDFARRLLLLARQKAPNTYTRPVSRFPRLPRLRRRAATGTSPSSE